MPLAQCNVQPLQMVAVGTAVARRPPHGSRRAELPHRALASDQTCDDCSSRAARTGSCRRSSRLPCGGPYSALCPINLFHRQALSLARLLPSILSAGSGTPPLFEDFAGTTSLSDFPPPCIAVVSLWVHGADLHLSAGRRRDLPASVGETD